jgi:hypothetical protein
MKGVTAKPWYTNKARTGPEELVTFVCLCSEAWSALDQTISASATKPDGHQIFMQLPYLFAGLKQ